MIKTVLLVIILTGFIIGFLAGLINKESISKPLVYLGAMLVMSGVIATFFFFVMSIVAG